MKEDLCDLVIREEEVVTTDTSSDLPKESVQQPALNKQDRYIFIDLNYQFYSRNPHIRPSRDQAVVGTHKNSHKQKSKKPLYLE